TPGTSTRSAGTTPPSRPWPSWRLAARPNPPATPWSATATSPATTSWSTRPPWSGPGWWTPPGWASPTGTATWPRPCATWTTSPTAPPSPAPSPTTTATTCSTPSAWPTTGCWTSSSDPVPRGGSAVREPGEDRQVAPLAGDLQVAAQHALVDEPGALGCAQRGGVARLHVHLQPGQAQLLQPPAGQQGQRAGGQAAAAVRRGDPVAQRGPAVIGAVAPQPDRPGGPAPLLDREGE